MRVKTFAVSILYGEGMHFFHGYYDTEVEAQLVADTQLASRIKAWKKGAKPTAYVWQLRIRASR